MSLQLMEIVQGDWLWTGYVESWSFVAMYCLFIFLAVIGLLQLIASKWELKGITFCKNKRWSYAFGTITTIGSFIWFFYSHDYTALTFDAPVQIFWISLSTFFAFLCTFTISHFIHRDMRLAYKKNDSIKNLDILKETTYWNAISQYLKDKSK